MSENKSGISCGFTSLLQLAFIILKLCGTIDWPWIWVLSPTWITFSIALVSVFIYLYFFWSKK